MIAPQRSLSDSISYCEGLAAFFGPAQAVGGMTAKLPSPTKIGGSADVGGGVVSRGIVR